MRAPSWPLHCLTGKTACSLTCNSFSAIALGPRFDARTSPLVVPALVVSLLWTSTLPIGLSSALSTGSDQPYGPLPSPKSVLASHHLCAARRREGGGAARAHGRAWAGGRGAQHRIPVHALSVRRLSSSCITRHIPDFYQLAPPAHLISHSTSLRA
jgi:hypothetical protein